MSVEILKNGSEKKIAEWERKHDRRKTWRCERCGCEWKCEWKDNKFGNSHEYNGDPDILCPECGSNDTVELTVSLTGDGKLVYCGDCKWRNGWDTDGTGCDKGHVSNAVTSMRCSDFEWRGYL